MGRARWARDSAVIAGLGLLARLGALAILGSQPAADTATYLRAAADWARAGYRPSWLLEHHRGFSPGYVAFLALTGGGQAGGGASMLVQTLIGAIVPALLYLALRKAGGSRLQAWLAAMAMVASYEITRWNGYVLTEPLFITAAALALMAAILALRPGGWRWAVGTGLSVLFALSVRPTGLAVAAGALGAATLWRPRRRDLVLATLAALVVYGAYLWLTPMPASRRLYGEGVCWYLVSGRVFWGSEQYGVRPLGPRSEWSGLGLARCFGRAAVTAPWGMTQVVGRRAIAFWMPVYGHYSFKHNAANLLLLGVPLALALVGAWRGIGAIRTNPLTLVPLSWVMAFTAQHALTWVERDHRLLAPVLPAVYVLAAGGAARVYRAWPRRLLDPGRVVPTSTDLGTGAPPEGARGERRY